MEGADILAWVIIAVNLERTLARKENNPRKRMQIIMSACAKEVKLRSLGYM